MRITGVLSCLMATLSASAAWITHPEMASLAPRNVQARQLERLVA